MENLKLLCHTTYHILIFYIIPLKMSQIFGNKWQTYNKEGTF